MKSHIPKIFLCFLCISYYFEVVCQDQKIIKFVPINSFSIEEAPFLTDSIEGFYTIQAEIIKADRLLKYQKFVQNEVIFAEPLLDYLEISSNIDINDYIVFITNKKLVPIEMPAYMLADTNLKFLIRGFSSKIGGNYAIISTYKLKNEARDADHYELLLIKTIRHEIGHLLGLHHCENDTCLMKSGYDSKIFQDTDYYLCKECRNMLGSISK